MGSQQEMTFHRHKKKQIKNDNKVKKKREKRGNRKENLQVLKRMTARRQAYSVASTFICLNLATVSWKVLISLSSPSWRSVLTVDSPPPITNQQFNQKRLTLPLFIDSLSMLILVLFNFFIILTKKKTSKIS